MAINYSKMALTAQRLIHENGRTVRYKKQVEDPTDPTKPWRGNGPTYEFKDVIGCVVDYTVDEVNRDLTKAGQKHILVAALDVVGVDLTEYDTVEDGADTLHVVHVGVVQPSTIAVMYDTRVKN